LRGFDSAGDSGFAASVGQVSREIPSFAVEGQKWGTEISFPSQALSQKLDAF